MRVNYVSESGQFDIVTENFINYTEDIDYIGIKPGEFHIITRDDIKFNFSYSIRSFKYFMNDKLDRSHEYYDTIRELVDSRGRDNLIIALEIVKTI